MSKHDSQVPKMDTVEPCAVAGCYKPGVTLDHALFHQRKKAPKAERDWTHDPHNIQRVCHTCNVTRAANTYEQREVHVKYWMELDPEGFREWLENAPYKIKLTDVWRETKNMTVVSK